MAIRETAIATITDILQVDGGSIDDQTRFAEDLDADSVDVVEVVAELESTLGTKLPDQRLAEIASVGDLVAAFEASAV